MGSTTTNSPAGQCFDTDTILIIEWATLRTERHTERRPVAELATLLGISAGEVVAQAREGSLANRWNDAGVPARDLPAGTTRYDQDVTAARLAARHRCGWCGGQLIHDGFAGNCDRWRCGCHQPHTSRHCCDFAFRDPARLVIETEWAELLGERVHTRMSVAEVGAMLGIEAALVLELAHAEALAREWNQTSDRAPDGSRVTHYADFEVTRAAVDDGAPVPSGPAVPVRFDLSDFGHIKWTVVDRPPAAVDSGAPGSVATPVAGDADAVVTVEWDVTERFRARLPVGDVAEALGLSVDEVARVAREGTLCERWDPDSLLPGLTGQYVALQSREVVSAGLDGT